MEKHLIEKSTLKAKIIHIRLCRDGVIQCLLEGLHASKCLLQIGGKIAGLIE